MANVLGLAGLRYLIDSAQSLPMDVLLTAPSCVPASALETSGATVTADDVAELLTWQGVVGLGEVMSFPAVVAGAADVLAKLHAATNRPVDGHAPLLSGTDLNAYVTAGPASDHECTDLEEAREKLRLGMWIMIREGAASRNLADLAPLVRQYGPHRCMLVSDDVHAQHLLERGHLDHALRRAVAEGIDPVDAVRMVTLSPTAYFGLRGRGAVAPGYVGDVAVVDDLREFHVRRVYKRGKLVAVDGDLATELPSAPAPQERPFRTAPISAELFAMRAGTGPARIIGVVPDLILTEALREPPLVRDGNIVQDLQRDILKVAVIERHRGTGNVGLGLVRGFALRAGALASSVAHDSHNIVVVGANDQDMAVAARRVAELRGGLVAVSRARVAAELQLPVAGLLSTQPAHVVGERIAALEACAARLGCTLPHPFVTLSFVTLAVIPELRVTDLGLVDVRASAVVALQGSAARPDEACA
jgi:adenine deaminase